MKHRPYKITWLFPIVVFGCSAYSKAFAIEPPTIRTANPLGGQPLTVGGGQHSEPGCDRPFEASGFKLTATPGEICIDEVVLHATHPSVRPADIEAIERVISGDAPKSVIRLAAVGPATNVSRCAGTPQGELVMWRQDFRGCTPNHGIITAATKLLGLARDDEQVDHDRPVTDASVESGRFLRFQFGD